MISKNLLITAIFGVVPTSIHAQHTAEATNQAASFAAASGEADLAKQLANPIASLISVPIQGNIDFGVGPGVGTRSVTNIQPAIPFELSENWNLISRTILPVIDQEGIAPRRALDGQKAGLWPGFFVNIHGGYRCGDLTNKGGTLSPTNGAMISPGSSGDGLSLTNLVITRALSETR